jgi:transposase InsO family protein
MSYKGTRATSPKPVTTAPDREEVARQKQAAKDKASKAKSDALTKSMNLRAKASALSKAAKTRRLAQAAGSTALDADFAQEQEGGEEQKTLEELEAEQQAAEDELEDNEMSDEEREELIRPFGPVNRTSREEEFPEEGEDTNNNDLEEGEEELIERILPRLRASQLNDVVHGTSSSAGNTFLKVPCKPMGTLVEREVRRVETEYFTQRTQGNEMSPSQLVLPQLEATLQQVLCAKDYLLTMYSTEWKEWKTKDFLDVLKKVLSSSSLEKVDSITDTAKLIGTTKLRVTSAGLDQVIGLMTYVNQTVTEHLSPELIACNHKETLKRVRDMIYSVFNNTPFGRAIVKVHMAIHRDVYEFNGWFQSLIELYFTSADKAKDARRLIEEEMREEIKAELKAAGWTPPSAGGNKTGADNKKFGGKRKYEAVAPGVTVDTKRNTVVPGQGGEVTREVIHPCPGCGKMHKNPAGCLWKQHPDYNPDPSVKWLNSAKGKLMNAKNPMCLSLNPDHTHDMADKDSWMVIRKTIPFQSKSKAAYKKTGKRELHALVKSMYSEDTIHDVTDNINSVCDDDGIRKCSLLNPLDNTCLLTLRVMLDTGALGQGSNYISKEVATRLKAIGYEPKIVDRVVCGCFVGSSKKITEMFKLNLSFKEPDGSFKRVLVNCDVINTRHDVIIGFNNIKRCAYLRELMERNISHKPQFNMTAKYCSEELVEDLETPDDVGGHDLTESSSRKSEADMITAVLPESETVGLVPDKNKNNKRNNPDTGSSINKNNKKINNPDPGCPDPGCGTPRKINPEKQNLNNVEIKKNKSEQPTKFGGPVDLISEAKTLCQELEQCFSSELSDTCANVTPMQITLNAEWETKDNCLNPRLQSRLKDTEITSQVSKMLIAKVITNKSRAMAHSQVMLTVKANGTWRFCIDYRRLNAVTQPNPWPLPRIKETLQRIGDKHPMYFAILDLTKGYYQAPLAENCQYLTAFITRDGKYEWQRVPMGLTGAPAYFQKVMSNEVLVGLVHHICEVYLDDIIIYGRNKEEFLTNLRSVLERLIEFNVTVNPDKCKIGLQEVEYVGHVINKDGITFSREKLQKVLDVSLPETAKHLRSFVGLANYFRDHVQNHSARIEPLIRLLDNYDPRKRIVWEGNEDAKAAFEDIKQAINLCPQLFFMDDESPVHLYTDASIKGVGAYLCQRKKDGQEYPIGFFSKSLNETEQNWGVPELEGYAIYAAFKHFDYLLRDAHTYVHTDHKNLVYIRDTGSDKVLRWKMMLQEYSFELEHVAGVDNPIADFWSRNEAAEVDDYIHYQPVTKGNMLCNMEATVEIHTCTTAGIAKMFTHYAEQQSEVIERELNTLELNANTAQFDLPHDKYEEIKAVHNPKVGHHGVDTTCDKLVAKGAKWTYMRQHVKKFIRECDTCQKNSYTKYDIRVQKYTTGSYYPMERIMIDTVSIPEDQWGYKGVVVIIDCFSRYMCCYPVKTFDAEEAADRLLEHTGHYGVPAQLFSDGGKQYVNAIIASFLEKTGTEHVVGMAYSHQEQSIVERSIRELSRWVRDMLYDSQVKHSLWSRYLPFAQRIHNATVVKTIGHSPAEILFGDRLSLTRNILIPQVNREHTNTEINEWMSNREQFQDTILKSAERLQKKHEEEHLKEDEPTPKLTDFPIGSYVLVAYPETGYGPRRPHKLFMMHRGPFKIVSRDDNNFKLLNLVNDKELTKSIFLLRPFYWNENETTPYDVAIKDYSDEYEVEDILEHKGLWSRKAKMTFHVKWLGYEDSTWEPWANVSNSSMLDEYLIRHGREKLSPRYKATE